MAFINIPLKDGNSTLSPDEFNYFVNKVNSLKLAIIQGAGFEGSLYISDTPDKDGWYFPAESGTYVNAGGISVQLEDNLNIIIASNNATTFSLVETPINFTVSQSFDKTSTTQVSSNKATYDGITSELTNFTDSKYLRSDEDDTTSGNLTVEQNTTTKGLTLSALGGFGSSVIEFQTETAGTSNFISKANIYTYAGIDYNTAMIFGTQAKSSSGNEFILPSFRIEEESNDVYFYQGIEVSNGVKIINGTSSDFLKADGTLDSNSYATSAELTVVENNLIAETDRATLIDNNITESSNNSQTHSQFQYSLRVLSDEGIIESLQSLPDFEANSYMRLDSDNSAIGNLTVSENIVSTYDGSDTNTGAYGISRTLSGLTANARGYRDDSIVTSPGAIGVSYAGVDIKTQMTNGPFNHVTMFQGRTSLDDANLSDFEGFYMGGLNFTNSSSATNYVGLTVENPTLFNGSITNFIGTNVKAPSRTGGTITNFYGLKIDDNVSATNKWAIYSDDDSVNSKMLGQLESGDITVQNTTTAASLNLNSSSTGSGGNYIHAKKSDGSNQWVFGSNNGLSDIITLRQYNEANINFQNNSGIAMTIDTNGDVGIGGDTQTNRKFKVHGNSAVDGNLYLSGDSSSYSIEVGQSRTTEGLAILDLTGEVSPDDYGLRMIRYEGENAESAIIHTGTSNLRIKAENGADTVFENTNVGIGTTNPQAALDIYSTNNGVLLPRMSTAQVNAIPSPLNGLTVYNTTLNTLCFFNGSSWQKVSHANM